MKNPGLALLMAGGRSRRMGRDKCTLPWRGRPMWEWQMQTLAALSPDKIAVTAPERPDWLPPHAGWLPDTAPDIGPLAGLLAGLRELKQGNMLVLAVDLPFMTADYLAALWAGCPGNLGSVPAGPKGWEPLAAVYPAGAADLADERLNAGRRDLQGWVDQLHHAGWVERHAIDPDNSTLFRNLNHPHQWEAALS